MSAYIGGDKKEVGKKKIDAAESLLQLSEPEANYSNLH